MLCPFSKRSNFLVELMLSWAEEKFQLTLLYLAGAVVCHGGGQMLAAFLWGAAQCSPTHLSNTPPSHSLLVSPQIDIRHFYYYMIVIVIVIADHC